MKWREIKVAVVRLESPKIGKPYIFCKKNKKYTNIRLCISF